MTLLEAVRFAVGQSLPNVICEVNSVILVSTSSQPSAQVSWDIRTSIYAITALKSHFHSLSFSQISRSANSLADRLAKWGLHHIASFLCFPQGPI